MSKKQHWLVKRVDTRLAKLDSDSPEHNVMIEQLEQLVKREKRRRVFTRMRKGYERDKKRIVELHRKNMRAYWDRITPAEKKQHVANWHASQGKENMAKNFGNDRFKKPGKVDKYTWIKQQKKASVSGSMPMILSG